MIYLSLTLLAPLLLPNAAPLQRADRQPPAPPTTVEPIRGERIVWYGTLQQGRAVATASKRPILLISAAPSCREVPGVW
ncbi:MAG: hypothetical protein COA70_13990 [Planctomycetota bacterium]|nr:MAG: hypothetical protein COA70_13990 [Planctomycetota bacterium]